MKIVIASDSFKDSSSSIEVANHIEKGILKVFPDAIVVKISIADGGEGTVDALILGAGGRYHTKSAVSPLGETRNAVFGILDNGTGIVEMAAASGLPLVPQERRNPMVTTTYGAGQLLKAAMDQGCRSIVIGVGGSATNDGGLGMAQALGVSFKDAEGRELGYGGGELGKLAAIDMGGLDPLVKDTNIIVASDVSSPLCGNKGASAVFGPQKGADASMVKTLDANLAHLAAVVKCQLGKDLADVPGAGAAGGLGYGLMAFCGAQIKSGVETVLDCVDIDKRLVGCNLVITGEGRIDYQSAFGKVPVGVAKRAKKFNLPVLAIVGGIGEGAEAVYEHGVDSIMSIVNDAMTLPEAIANVGILLEEAAERALRMIGIGLVSGMK